jgi:hypothetical protein
MRSDRIVAITFLAAAFLLIPPFARGQSGGFPPQVRRQLEPSPPAPTGSQKDDATLELAPQAGALPRRSETDVIPGGKRPALGAETAEERPYLGITTQETDRCYLGGEEYGMEIVTVDPGSPAAAAGLRGCSPVSEPGAGVFRHQLDLALHALRTLGEGDGDLIVAVNDQRVRVQRDLDWQLSSIKPDDTIYLTVIRPVNSMKHETLKIMVHVGRWKAPVAAAPP